MFISQWVSVENHPTVDAIAWRSPTAPEDGLEQGTLVAHTDSTHTSRSRIFYEQFERLMAHRDEWSKQIERDVVDGLLYDTSVADIGENIMHVYPSSGIPDGIGLAAAQTYSAVMRHVADNIGDAYTETALVSGALMHTAGYVYSQQLSSVALATVLREDSNDIAAAKNAVSDALRHETAVNLYALHTGKSVFVR